MSKKVFFTVKELLAKESEDVIINKMYHNIFGNVCSYMLDNCDLNMTISSIMDICCDAVEKQYRTIMSLETETNRLTDPFIIFPRFEYRRDNNGYVIVDFCITSKHRIDENRVEMMPITTSPTILLEGNIYEKWIDKAFPYILNHLFRVTWKEDSTLGKYTKGKNPYPRTQGIKSGSMFITNSHFGKLDDKTDQVIDEIKKEFERQEKLQWKMVNTVLTNLSEAYI